MEAKRQKLKENKFARKTRKREEHRHSSKNIIAYITTAKNAERRERRLKTQKGHEINKKERQKAKQELRKRT